MSIDAFGVHRRLTMTRLVHLCGAVALACVAQGIHAPFPYETTSLSDTTLKDLIETNGAADKAHLFAFDNGTDFPGRLKSGACKTFPADEDWPSLTTWDTFGRLLGGGLIKTIPAAAPCYTNLGVYDVAKCNAVIQNFTNQHFQ